MVERFIPDRETIAEPGQFIVGKASPSIVVIPAWRIGRSEGGHIFVPTPGKTSADVPKSIAG
jgi:hypothetical protein